jgi:hypothetical protein
MKRYLLVLAFVVGIVAPALAAYSIIITPVAGGAVYYLSEAGNDANNGLTPATAWATPKHQTNCGDTILIQPAHYGGTPFAGTFQSPNPKSCTGTDLYLFVKGNGTHLQDVTIDGQVDGNQAAINLGNVSNIALMNLTATNNHSGVGYNYCLGSGGTSGRSGHHILFINVYAHDCTWSAASASQNDYVAFIGVIVYHAAFQTFTGGGGCPSNLSIINSFNYDTKPGPHFFTAGMFSMKAGTNASCVDGHGLIYDGLNTNGFKGLAVIEQSMFLQNGMAGIHHFNSAGVTFHEKSSTVWGNAQATAAGVTMGDVNMQVSGVDTMTNMIIVSTIANMKLQNACPPPGEPCPTRYAIQDYYQTATCANCDVFAPNSQYCYNTGYYALCGTSPQSVNGSNDVTFTSSVNVDPQFVNTSVVPATAPDCSKAITTTACMAPIVAGFTTTNPAVAGMGYQSAGACAPDADWPPWIDPNIVPDGIITKPCAI